MGKNVEKADVACPRCGRVTRWSKSALERGRGRYCSRGCYEASRAATFVKITCGRCGREREVRDIYVNRGQYKFCSVECRAISKPEERTFRCVTCGKEFVGWFRRRRFHCSLACRKRRVVRPCGHCGTPVELSRERVEKSKRLYCSRRCYRLDVMPLAQKAMFEAFGEAQVECVAEHPVGRYLVDLYLPTLGVAIEVDGDYWHELPRQRAKDKVRDAFLRRQGLRVIHVAERPVRDNPSAAVQEVLHAIER